MLCDNCLHKIVCKEIENFKKYEKQYKEMKEVSSLFDKPIECPCYIKTVEKEKDFKEDIKNLEIVRTYLSQYLDRTRPMTYTDVRAFMIVDEVLKVHTNNLNN